MTEFISEISRVVSENKFMAGILSMYGLGVTTFFLRNVPRSISDVLKKYLTTTISVSSSNKIYFDIMKWMELKGFSKKLRRVKLSNGQWGDDKGVIKGVGYGIHFIFYHKLPILINLKKEDTTSSDKDKDFLNIVVLGRSHKLIDKLIDEVIICSKDLNKTHLYSFYDSYWKYISTQHKRSLDSVFIPKQDKDKLLNTFDNFINKESWYIDRCIPYQLGILLYGSQGTGKTSLIKAIAGHFNKKLCIVPASNLSSVSTASDKLLENSIMVIEDIDSNISSHSRINTTELLDEYDTDNEQPLNQSLIKGFSAIGLSEILNSFDGIFTTHGRIIITTTNRIEKLDKALIRPGRIDLLLEIGYVTIEVFKEFCSIFYPNIKVGDTDTIKEKVSVAQLQQSVLENYTEKDFITKYMK